jgi:hypothetical protein
VGYLVMLLIEGLLEHGALGDPDHQSSEPLSDPSCSALFGGVTPGAIRKAAA